MGAVPSQFALIIGAMKAGTTSLYRYLASHSRIAASREKELFPFARENFPRTLADYARLWDWDVRVHRVALEASTDYAKFPAVRSVPERVAELGARHFKMIYIIRHPLRRIESHVRHMIWTRQEVCGFPEPVRDFSLDAGVTDNQIAFSSYARQLDEWARFFSADQIHILTLEALISDPVATLRNIARFLAIDDDASFQEVTTIHGQSPDPVNAPQLRRRIFSVDAVDRVITGMLPQALRSRLQRSVANRPPRDKLNETETVFVLEQLLPDIQRLGSEYGVDTRKWWGLG